MPSSTQYQAGSVLGIAQISSSLAQVLQALGVELSETNTSLFDVVGGLKP
jgi:hypothetical protein